jgi:endonuclease/exonuclease/phosphatase family metal-dependent hydrolase
VAKNMKAFELIVMHLSKVDSAICVIQEWDEIEISSNRKVTLNDLKEIARRKSKSKYYIVNKNHDKTLFLVDRKINTEYVATINSINRFSTIKLNTTRFGPIMIVGLHGYDVINYPLRGSRRIDFDKKLAEAIDTHSDTTPTIIIGDFNCPPYYEGLCSISGLFARRDKDELSKYKNSKKNAKRVYYNPSWKLLNNSDPMGTFYHHDLYQEVNWLLIDQVILSEELSSLTCNLSIIDKLDTESLLNRNGNINKNISDHLPIMAEIDL